MIFRGHAMRESVRLAFPLGLFVGTVTKSHFRSTLQSEMLLASSRLEKARQAK